jgi:hypothetical protein
MPTDVIAAGGTIPAMAVDEAVLEVPLMYEGFLILRELEILTIMLHSAGIMIGAAAEITIHTEGETGP